MHCECCFIEHQLRVQMAAKDRRIAALEDAVRTAQPSGKPAHVVRCMLPAGKRSERSLAAVQSCTG